MPLLGGVRPPIAVLLCLLLAVVALAMLALGTTVAEDVPQAVLTSQQHIAADTASEIRAAVNQDVAAVRESATALSEAQAPDDAGYLKLFTSLGTHWRGAALVDPTTGKELAVTGEAFPASAVSAVAANDTIAPKLVTLRDGQTRLLAFASVDLPGQGRRLLVGSDVLSVQAPGGDLTRTVQAVNQHGKVVASVGPALTTIQDRRIPTDAATTSAQQGDINSTTRPSGFLLGSLVSGKRTVAGWADVASQADGSADALHLVAVVAVSTPQTSAVTGNTLVALTAAASLIVATLLITALLVLGLQRPLLRLHLGGARLARGDLSRPAPQPRLGEAARIGHALEALRVQQLGASPQEFQPLRRSFGSRALVVLCGVVLVAWSVPLLFLVDRPTPNANTVPTQMVSDQQLRTVAAAGRISSSLATGSTDVSGIATAIASLSSPDQIQLLLSRTLKEHGRYSTLYVLAQDGSVISRAGGSPRHQLSSVPQGDGVLQLNTGGKVPSMAVYATVPKTANAIFKKPTAFGSRGPVAVVGEFDTTYLNSILNHAGMGHVWLVDARHKVIGSPEGFKAFQSLPDSSLTSLAVDSPSQPAHSLVPTSDGPAIAASAPVSAIPGVSRQPSWQVVSSQPVSWLDLSANRTQHLTMLVGLIGLTVSVLCLGWLLVVVVRPLRELSGIAERLAAGDRRTVLYPVHHDEVGSITRSLEIIRQRLVAGHHSTASTPAASAPRY